MRSVPSAHRNVSPSRRASFSSTYDSSHVAWTVASKGILKLAFSPVTRLLTCTSAWSEGSDRLSNLYLLSFTKRIWRSLGSLIGLASVSGAHSLTARETVAHFPDLF